jgi:hypothetical protein
VYKCVCVYALILTHTQGDGKNANKDEGKGKGGGSYWGGVSVFFRLYFVYFLIMGTSSSFIAR